MDDDQFEEKLKSLIDLEGINSRTGETNFVITALEQQTLLRLARILFYPQQKQSEPLVFGTILKYILSLLSNPKCSPLIPTLLDTVPDENKAAMLIEFGHIVPASVLTAIVNISQFFSSTVQLDLRTPTIRFQKNIRAHMEAAESFHLLISTYMNDRANTRKPKLNFVNYRQEVLPDLNNNALITKYTNLNMTPLSNITKDMVFDAKVINDLRLAINDSFVKTAFFNEINMGASKVYELFAVFNLQ